MKQLLPLLLLLLIALISQSQDKFVWPIKELDTARDVTYLTSYEKDVILEINKVRYNPAIYARECMSWIAVFYEGKFLKLPGKEQILTNEGKKAFDDCMKALAVAKPAPKLYPSGGMSKACKLLVYDQEATGKTGHKGAGNSQPTDRVKKFGTFEGTYAENIQYGESEPALTVIALLIDDGVKSRGHRETILNPDFHYTGIAIGKHKTYGQMCVCTYATNFHEN